MADTTTKSIAARVPMDVYVKIITEAAERRQTVSDYVIMRLFSTDGNTGQNTAENTTEKDKTIASLQKQVKELQNAQKEAGTATDNKELVKAQKEIEKLNQKLAEQLTSIRSKNGIVVNRDQEIREKGKRITVLESELKTMATKLEASQSNSKSQDLINTSQEKTIERLKRDIERLKSEVDSLKKDVIKNKKLADDKEKLLSLVKTTNESIKKELEDYNERNSSFFGGEPIGEEFMAEISDLLTKHF